VGSAPETVGRLFNQENAMTRYAKQAAAAVTLMFTALAATPAASAYEHKNVRVDAKLYEVTENMFLDNLAAPKLRTATAALQGTAKLGSPLCPGALVQLLANLGLLTRADKPCTITAIGGDEVNIQTGSGMLTGGEFQVVINLDNTTDAPEFVVMTGTFGGDMQVLVDMSANPPAQLPLIALTNGTFKPLDVLGVPIAYIAALGLDPAHFGEARFTGTFRLPFALDRRGKRSRAHSSRDAFYLGDHGQLIRVQPDERSLGFPTVRVEINF
jgi:hypothetical protein